MRGDWGNPVPYRDGSIPLAAGNLQSGRLCRLDLPKLETKDGYWLTFPEERVRSKRQRALIDDFLQALREAI